MTLQRLWKEIGFSKNIFAENGMFVLASTVQLAFEVLYSIAFTEEIFDVFSSRNFVACGMKSSAVISVFLGVMFVVVCHLRVIQTALPPLPIVILSSQPHRFWDPVRDYFSFHVYYAGDKNDTIAINKDGEVAYEFSNGKPIFWTEENGDTVWMLPPPVKSNHPYALGEMERRNYHFANDRKATGETMKITVSENLVLKGTGNWRAGCKNVRTIFAENTSQDTLIPGSNNEIHFSLEKWNGNEWQTIHHHLAGCGNGQFYYFLPPGKIAVALERIDTHGIPHRLLIGKNVSNVFK